MDNDSATISQGNGAALYGLNMENFLAFNIKLLKNIGGAEGGGISI